MTVYRTAGAWGAGKGSNLTAAEVDLNFYDQQVRLNDLETSRPQPDNFANVSIVGTQITFTLASGAILATIDLPVLKWRWRDEWIAFTGYAALDVFSVAGSGLYLVRLDHLSAATFDPNAVDGSSNPLYHLLIGTSSNTTLNDLADVDVSGVAANSMLVAVASGSPEVISWEDRTPAQVTALLSDFSGDTGSPGGGVKGLVPAPADGDLAAGKVLGAGGEWVPSRSPISDLPLATPPVAALSLLEIAETDGGSPEAFTSKHIRIADLVHTLGSTEIAMGDTVPEIAGLTMIGATYHFGDVADSLTAVGTNRATALQLAAQMNNVTTAATGTGVILPVGIVGMEIDIFAAAGIAAATIQVYASASETIDTVAGATGVVLTQAKRCRYKFVAANTWVSAQWGAISA